LALFNNMMISSGDRWDAAQNGQVSVGSVSKGVAIACLMICAGEDDSFFVVVGYGDFED